MLPSGVTVLLWLASCSLWSVSPAPDAGPQDVAALGLRIGVPPGDVAWADGPSLLVGRPAPEPSKKGDPLASLLTTRCSPLFGTWTIRLDPPVVPPPDCRTRSLGDDGSICYTTRVETDFECGSGDLIGALTIGESSWSVHCVTSGESEAGIDAEWCLPYLATLELL